MKEERKPFYKSVKKTLGVIGFGLYWGLQVVAVLEDPTIIVELSLENSVLILGLLGIKTIGGVMTNKKEN